MLQCQTKYIAHSLLVRQKTIEESNLIISNIKYFFQKSHYFYLFFPPPSYRQIGKLQIMAIWIVKFLSEGHKIR